MSAPAVTPDAPPAVDPAGASHAPSSIDVPRDTTPTFELEMLVSGAVLFGLFQLPDLLASSVRSWSPHFGLFGIFVGAGVGLLLVAAIYTLIACFVLHLALRAYWVALVGVDSVFPKGVRWERMKEAGPITKAIHRERIQPLPRSIARVDNAASLVFATGFALAAGTFSGIAGLLLAGLGVAAIVVFDPPRPELVLAGVLGPMALVLMLSPLLDYKFGHRLRGLPRRAVDRTLRFSMALMPASLSTMSSVMSTNVDKRIVYGVLVVGFGSAVASAGVPRLGDQSLPGSGSYDFFDDGAEVAGVQPAFYESLRGDEASDRAPSIQSDVVTEPYVRLFIPYVTIRHNTALADACPGLRPLDADRPDRDPAAQAAREAVLRCALKVHRPALDGRPLDGHRFRFFANPRTNRRGFLMLVPVDGLARGEHRLTVWPARRRGTGPATEPYTIPFWR